MTHPENDTETPTAKNSQPRKRQLMQIVIPVGVATALAIAAVFWYGAARNQETTEDAYVEGNIVQVTPQVSGVVTAIGADNTDYIAGGQVLVHLNDVDAQLSLARAQAALARAVRQVRGQFAAASQTKANRDLKAADLNKAQADVMRRKALVASGAISGEELYHAEDALVVAKAAFEAAEQQLVGSRAQIDGTSVSSHPDVMSAATQVRDAYVALQRTVIRAPVSGVVTKRSVQVGQRVNAGTALMSVVPLNHLWVSANFKESQLRHIRIGQPVALITDVYGREVEYQGVVVGQDAGTGSAFALLPAQNATGNWIKVVQRVPVRIALDSSQIATHPLRVGLSMKVIVNTTKRDGKAVAEKGHSPQSYKTDIFANELANADEMVNKLIQANL